MAKTAYRPYFIQLVMKDWLADTARLSLAAQGLWARILCHMALEPVRGIYERTIMEASRELGCDKDQLLTLLSELSKFKSVRISKDIVRLESGRMLRDERKRKRNAFYQADYRSKAIVRRSLDNSKGKMLDVRSHKLLTSNIKKTRARETPLDAPLAPRQEPEAMASEPAMTPEEMQDIKRRHMGHLP